MSKLEEIKVCLIVMSTNRLGYLHQCLDSFQTKVQLGKVQLYKILVDDLPTDRNDKYFRKKIGEKYGFDQVVLNPKNLGLDRNLNNIWKHVPADCQYVWQHEDDHIFIQNVSLDEMIATLEHVKIPGHHLVKIGFHRYDWHHKNNGCLKYDQIPTHTWFDPELQKELTISYHDTFLCFGFGSCIYHRNITEKNFEKYQLPQEGTICPVIRSYIHPKGKLCCALVRHRGDPPNIKHIGDICRGFPVSPGMAGFDAWNSKQKYQLAQKNMGMMCKTGRPVTRYGVPQFIKKPNFSKEEPIAETASAGDKINYYHWLLAMSTPENLSPEKECYIYCQLVRVYRQNKNQPELIRNTLLHAEQLFTKLPENKELAKEFEKLAQEEEEARKAEEARRAEEALDAEKSTEKVA